MKKVYVFDMNNEFIKIGISVDVKKRASSISSSSGYAVLRHYESALMSDDDARAIERDLHAHFKTYRALGEFFKITFEEACDELNKRAELNKLKTAGPVNLKKRERTQTECVTDIMRKFVKKNCTTDRNKSGFSGGGIFRTVFLEAFIEWFNAHSNTFACEKEYFGGSLEAAMEMRRVHDDCRWFTVRFYCRATGEELFATEGFDILSEAVNDSDVYNFKVRAVHTDKIRRYYYDDRQEEFYSGIYWRQGTPQEQALQQRVQRVRDAFTGLDQQAKDSIIGGFVNNVIEHIKPSLLSRRDSFYDLFQPHGLCFGAFVDKVVRHIEDNLCKLCGENFRVHIESERVPLGVFMKEEYGGGLSWSLAPYSRHRGIIVHPFTYDLDDDKIGVYYGSFTQIIQRYCPLEVFADRWGLRVRHTGKVGA